MRWTVAIIFAMSGAAALALETVWNRWLALALGSASHSTTVVLACFMGGLGLGAWWAGKLADRLGARSLRAFAWAEIGIGIWAFLSEPLLVDLLPNLSAQLAGGLGFETLPGALRALLAAGSLAIPTILMGASLPLLARWVVSQGSLAGGSIGALYAANSCGGAFGTLAATFVTIDRWGLPQTAWTAGAIDLLVGIGAWWLSRSREGAPTTHQTAALSPSPALGRLWIPLLAYFGTGFIGLALEVIYYRVLVTLLGASVYAFAIMLAAFLLGLTGGSAGGAWLARRSYPPRLLLTLSLGGLAIGSGIALMLLDPTRQHAIQRVAASLPLFGSVSFGGDLVLCLLGLLPATIALGAVVPAIARVAATIPDGLGRTFGAAYALNTFGAVSGTIAAHLLLIPQLGTAGATRALVVLASLLGLIVAPKLSARASVCVLGPLALWLTADADPARDALTRQIVGMEPLQFAEGPVQTLLVARSNGEEQLEHLRLLANRSTLTGTQFYSQRYMRLLGHLPVLFAESPKRALVICLGTGMTAGAVALHPRVERLDIAEISPEVVAVEQHFRPANGSVLQHPKSRLHVDDGRHVLLAAAEPWDVITLEPPPPRDTGVVSLYTREFYQLAASRLTPGGVIAQWIPLHSQSVEEMQMEVAAFLEVFPYAIGAIPVERELLLLGSRQALPLSTERFGEMTTSPAVASSLAAIGFEDPAVLLGIFFLDRSGLERFARGAEPLSDAQPHVEYYLRFGKDPPRPDTSQWLIDPAPFSGPRSGEAEVARSALAAFLRGWFLSLAGNRDAAAQSGMEALRKRPDDPYFLWTMRISDQHIRRIEARAETARSAELWIDAALRWLDRGRPVEAVHAAKRAIAIDPQNQTARELLATTGAD
jgi:spermidine synthase